MNNSCLPWLNFLFIGAGVPGELQIMEGRKYFAVVIVCGCSLLFLTGGAARQMKVFSNDSNAEIPVELASPIVTNS